MRVHGVWSRLSNRLRGPRPPALKLLIGDEGYAESLLRAGPPWAGAVLVGTLLSVLAARSGETVFHRGAAIALVLVTLLVAAAPVAFWSRSSREPPVGWAELLGLPGALLAPLIVAALGPLHQESAVFLPAFAAAVFVFTSRRGALILTGLSMLGYAIVVLTGHGYVDAVTRIGIAASFTGTTAVLMVWIVARLELLASRERASAVEVGRLAAELTETNRTLEVRVATQVDQIESLSRLERFLSPQVARAVLSSSEDALLEPHRREVAVLFCDLRGFTAFSSRAEPEELVGVLDAYYKAAGNLVHAHGATMGNFLGDGVMAYFNDPFPCDDPTWRAVALAVELRAAVLELVVRWQARGFYLGAGIGVAWGYATLGTFGFEGRSDYTALGSVVNLAARLCAEAEHGEVLLDARLHDAVRNRVSATAVDAQLKGLPGNTRAFRLDQVVPEVRSRLRR